MSKTLLAQGAEAKVERDGDCVIKTRLAKPYRNETIDKKIRKFRTKREFKILTYLYEKQIGCIKPLEHSLDEMSITTAFANGELLINTIDKSSIELAIDTIAKMHNEGVMHGDLTPKNILIKDEQAVLLDFGLGRFDARIEDKAEDMHLFCMCLINQGVSDEDIEKYKEEYREKVNDGERIYERLVAIEQRGRNKAKKA